MLQNNSHSKLTDLRLQEEMGYQYYMRYSTKVNTNDLHYNFVKDEHNSPFSELLGET